MLLSIPGSDFAGNERKAGNNGSSWQFPTERKSWIHVKQPLLGSKNLKSYVNNQTSRKKGWMSSSRKYSSGPTVAHTSCDLKFLTDKRDEKTVSPLRIPQDWMIKFDDCETIKYWRSYLDCPELLWISLIIFYWLSLCLIYHYCDYQFHFNYSFKALTTTNPNAKNVMKHDLRTITDITFLCCNLTRSFHHCILKCHNLYLSSFV